MKELIYGSVCSGIEAAPLRGSHWVGSLHGSPKSSRSPAPSYPIIGRTSPITAI